MEVGPTANKLSDPTLGQDLFSFFPQQVPVPLSSGSPAAVGSLAAVPKTVGVPGNEPKTSKCGNEEKSIPWEES